MDSEQFDGMDSEQFDGMDSEQFCLLACASVSVYWPVPVSAYTGTLVTLLMALRGLWRRGFALSSRAMRHCRHQRCCVAAHGRHWGWRVAAGAGTAWRAASLWRYWGRGGVALLSRAAPGAMTGANVAGAPRAVVDGRTGAPLLLAPMDAMGDDAAARLCGDFAALRLMGATGLARGG